MWTSALWFYIKSMYLGKMCSQFVMSIYTAFSRFHTNTTLTPMWKLYLECLCDLAPKGTHGKRTEVFKNLENQQYFLKSFFFNCLSGWLWYCETEVLCLFKFNHLFGLYMLSNRNETTSKGNKIKKAIKFK